MATFDLPQGAENGTETRETDHGEGDSGSSFEFLQANAIWFIRLRWLVVFFFFALALFGSSGLAQKLGLHLEPLWLLEMGAALFFLNLFFYFQCRRIPQQERGSIRTNLWLQIIFDLCAVCVVIIHVGATESFAPFLFAVHVVLSCIFFKPRESFIVLLISIALYLGCVILQFGGFFHEGRIFLGVVSPQVAFLQKSIHVGSAIGVWTTMWYLVIKLCMLIRQREQALREMEQKTLSTYQAGQKHLLHVGHQMKAPVDAIRGNLDLLRELLKDQSNAEVIEILDRVNLRGKILGEMVMDVLRLARLKAGENRDHQHEKVDLGGLLRQCVHFHENAAIRKNVKVLAEIPDCFGEGDPESLKMLFDNLVTNAINYSKPGGEVHVKAEFHKETREVTVKIRDQGIGIPAEKLHRVFDEFYRTPEAKRHNPHSTGVGLAIVKQVARSHRVKVRLESAVDEGTTFILIFPDCREEG